MGQGLHVLVEKPLAGTKAECDVLVDEARRRQVVLQVGHVERFNPALIAAQPYLRDVKYVEAVRRGPYSFRSTDIGVVLDLMIHDLDVILAVVRSPVVRVEALGVAIFGAHEDVANARLVFANGCVASLSASRASQLAARVMQAFAARSFTAIDFGARTASVVRPSDALLARELALDEVPAAQRASLKDELFGQHLPAQRLEVVDRDQITAELEDFVASIRDGRAPVVTGDQARDAVAVAERILESMASHCWNGTLDGPMGPLAQPGPQILRGPHWPGALPDAPHRETPGQGHAA
jgi:predicted dehydrogenase